MKKLMIGIDLGTTYSCAAVLTDAGTVEMASNKDSGDSTTPSVVLIQPKKKNLVGSGAKSLIGPLVSADGGEAKEQRDNGFYLHPKNTKAVIETAKRHIGTKKVYKVGKEEYNPTFVSGAILKKIKQDVEESYGQKVDSAVITVPANFNNQKRQETIDAAHIAGLQVDYILNEPTSAALAYSMSSQIDGIYAVYDFGGGTFDCSIVETKGEKVTILGSNGVQKLGGRDLDERLLEIVRTKYKKETKKDINPRQFSPQDAERQKIRLSTLDEIEVVIDGGKAIVITRKEFEESISILVNMSLASFDNALVKANKKHGITIDNIMDVILVGGTSRVPLVQEALKNKIGKKPKVYGNPDETVAKGAAIYVALNNKRSLNVNQKAAISGLEIKEITNVCLGETLAAKDGDIISQPIIEKGSRIPASKSNTSFIPFEMIKASITNQLPAIPVKQTITESYTDAGINDIVSLDDVEIVFDEDNLWIPSPLALKMQAGDDIASYSKIKTTFKIDANQVFRIIVKHPYSGTTLVDKELSMKEGSLGATKGGLDDDLDGFDIE